MIQQFTFRRLDTGTLSAGSQGVWLPATGNDPLITSQCPLFQKKFTVLAARIHHSLSCVFTAAPNAILSASTIISRQGLLASFYAFFSQASSFSSDFALADEVLPSAQITDPATGYFHSVGKRGVEFTLLQPVLEVPAVGNLYSWRVITTNGVALNVDCDYTYQSHLSLTVEV